MSKNVLTYWFATGLFAAGMLGGGIADLLLHESIQEAMAHLGYPLYVAVIIGVFKVFGVVAILWPKRPILKEWAYAGFMIDLVGALSSHLVVGDPPKQWIPIFAFMFLGLLSYITRPECRRP